MASLYVEARVPVQPSEVPEDVFLQSCLVDLGLPVHQVLQPVTLQQVLERLLIVLVMAKLEGCGF